jgi:hypothetical protein
MSQHNPFRVGGLFNLIGSALAVAAAVESGRAPRNRDLRGLGIEPEQFRKIRY